MLGEKKGFSLWSRQGLGRGRRNIRSCQKPGKKGWRKRGDGHREGENGEVRKNRFKVWCNRIQQTARKGKGRQKSSL